MFVFFRIIALLWCVLLAPFLLQAQLVVELVDVEDRPIEDVAIYGGDVFLAVTNRAGKAFIEGDYEVLNFRHINYKPLQVELQAVKELKVVMHKNPLTAPPVELVSHWADIDQAIPQTNINKEEIAYRDFGKDMPEQLRMDPSVVVHTDAGAGIGYSYMRVRGSDQERTAVSINGVPLNDPESHQVFWVDLPDFAASTSQIQLQKGLGLSTQGVGAFGASLLINTSHIDSEAQGNVTLGYGSFNSFRAKLQASSGLLRQKYYVQGRLSYIRSDGYIDRASSDLRSYFLTAGMVDAGQSLTLNVFSGHEITYQAWNGTPYHYIDIDSLRTYNPSGTEKPGTPYEDEVDNYKQTHAQLIYKKQWSDRVRTNLTGHYTKGRGYFELYKADFLMIEDVVQRRWLDNDFFGLIVSTNWQTSDKTEWNIGMAMNRYLGDHFGQIIWREHMISVDQQIEEYYRNDAVKDDINAYVQWKRKWSVDLNSFVDIQYRQVGYRYEGPDASGAILDQKVVHRFLNPKFGLHYQPTPWFTTYAYAGYGHKEPNRNDYVESTSESRPRPEKMLNTELGLMFQKHQWNVSTNFYLMRYKDQLITTGLLNDVGAVTRVNIADSYRRGVETSVGFKTKRLSFELAANFSKNKALNLELFRDVYNDDYELVGQTSILYAERDLALSPRTTFSSQIFWHLNDALDLRLESKYVSRMYLDNSQSKTASIDPYWFSNFMARWQFKQALRAKMAVYNLFDRRYESFGWVYNYIGPSFGTEYSVGSDDGVMREIALYPQAGRHFMLSLEYCF